MKDTLLGELFERAAIVEDLNGPQVEAWVSGLFPLFGDDVSAGEFVTYCVNQQSTRGTLLCLALAELTDGFDNPAELPVEVASVETQIGASTLTEAWRVDAPFGRTIVLGFENSVSMSTDDADDDVDDASHSILVELAETGQLEDLQLAGPPRLLIEEAASEDERVAVTDVDPDDAVAQIVAAWPTSPVAGAGVQANQQFVRRRLYVASGQMLPPIPNEQQLVDIQRGLDSDEFADANRAALSTLQAALGSVDADPANEIAQIWASIIRGDGGDLSLREREGLIWLEWADWLGAGIGLERAGEGSGVSGEIFVDLVNRCPEVSSTIDKRDREFAAWAFDVALDLLQDCGAVEDGALTAAGYQALVPAMLLAWGD